MDDVPDNAGLVTRIVLLGTGTPIADPDRAGPSVAVMVGETPYLVDLGPGVVRRAAAAHRAGVRGLAVENLRLALLTHLHSDHTTGYPDFIFTPWVLGRDEPAEVYGPPGIRAMTEHLLAAYERDIHERLHGLEPAHAQGYRVHTHEIEPGIVYRDSQVLVEAFPVRHGKTWQAFGYKFTTPDRTIVISGDTAPLDTLVEQATGCDVLIHEVYSTTAFERLPPEWKTYHSAYHTSSHRLAEIASAAKPGLLILYHQLFWDISEEVLLKEVQEKYKGQVVSGKDLEIY